MKEIFKDIKGYEGLYQISNFGNVKSFIKYKGTNERILKMRANNRGYFYVCLHKKGGQKYFTAHRLAALTFIPNPSNKRTVNHINGVKTDNRLFNLEWNTDSENISHAYRSGLKNSSFPIGEKHHSSKHTSKEILEIRDLAKSKRFKQSEIAEFYNCGQKNIGYIVNRKIWKHI